MASENVFKTHQMRFLVGLYVLMVIAGLSTVVWVSERLLSKIPPRALGVSAGVLAIVSLVAYGIGWVIDAKFDAGGRYD